MRRLALFLAIALLLVAGAAPVAAKSGPAVINLPNGFRPEGLTRGGDPHSSSGRLVERGDLSRRFQDRHGRGLHPGHRRPGRRRDRVRASPRPALGGGRHHRAGPRVQRHDRRPAPDLPVHRSASSSTTSSSIAAPCTSRTRTLQQLHVIPLGPRRRAARPEPGLRAPDHRRPRLRGRLQCQWDRVVRGGGCSSSSRTRAQLFRVNPATGASTQIDLGGASVGNGDGVEVHGRRIYVVRNQLNLVAVFRANGSFTAATLLGNLTKTGRTGWTCRRRARSSASTSTSSTRGSRTPRRRTTTYWIVQLPRRP